MFATKYPESLGVALIINAPFIFWACWKIVSSWIDPLTAKKIIFTSPDKLIEWIDPEHIPVYYGGKDEFVWEKQGFVEKK
jgi:hypothetical protein